MIDRNSVKIICLVLGILFFGMGLVCILMVIVSIVDVILGAYVNGIWDTFLFFCYTLLYLFAGTQGIIIFRTREDPDMKAQIRRSVFFIITIVVIILGTIANFIVYFGFAVGGIGLFIIPGLNHDRSLTKGENIVFSILLLFFFFICVAGYCCCYLTLACLNFVVENEYYKSYGKLQSAAADELGDPNMNYFKTEYNQSSTVIQADESREISTQEQKNNQSVEKEKQDLVVTETDYTVGYDQV